MNGMNKLMMHVETSLLSLIMVRFRNKEDLP